MTSICGQYFNGLRAIARRLDSTVIPWWRGEGDWSAQVYLRERFLSHHLWPSYDDILDACCAAWNALLEETGRIHSLCTLDCATVSS